MTTTEVCFQECRIKISDTFKSEFEQSTDPCLIYSIGGVGKEERRGFALRLS